MQLHGWWPQGGAAPRCCASHSSRCVAHRPPPSCARAVSPRRRPAGLALQQRRPGGPQPQPAQLCQHEESDWQRGAGGAGGGWRLVGEVPECGGGRVSAGGGAAAGGRGGSWLWSMGPVVRSLWSLPGVRRTGPCPLQSAPPPHPPACSLSQRWSRWTTTCTSRACSRQLPRHAAGVMPGCWAHCSGQCGPQQGWGAGASFGRATGRLCGMLGLLLTEGASVSAARMLREWFVCCAASPARQGGRRCRLSCISIHGGGRGRGAPSGQGGARARNPFHSTISFRDLLPPPPPNPPSKYAFLVVLLRSYSVGCPVPRRRGMRRARGWGLAAGLGVGRQRQGPLPVPS